MLLNSKRSNFLRICNAKTRNPCSRHCRNKKEEVNFFSSGSNLTNCSYSLASLSTVSIIHEFTLPIPYLVPDLSARGNPLRPFLVYRAYPKSVNFLPSRETFSVLLLYFFIIISRGSGSPSNIFPNVTLACFRDVQGDRCCGWICLK